jgi:hypothetical protein
VSHDVEVEGLDLAEMGVRAYPETANIGGGGAAAVMRDEAMPGKPLGGVSPVGAE